MLGFKNFHAAQRTVGEIEVLAMIKKGQMERRRETSNLLLNSSMPSPRSAGHPSNAFRLGRVFATEPLIAIIGKHWLTVTDEEGHRRLDNTEDFVRIEIKAALKRDIPVIPFLVGGARMPKSVSFPKVLMK